MSEPEPIPAGNLTVFANVGPQSGAAPLSVWFDGLASGGVPPYMFTWQFGDGGSWSGNGTANISHVFTVPGVFESRLHVNDSAGESAAGPVVRISVRDESLLAVAIDARPRWGNAPHAVYFGSTVTGGSPPYSFAWDLGDGTVVDTQYPNHTYIDAGKFTVVLRVNDSVGAQANSTPIIIEVGERLPWLTVLGEGMPRVGEAPLIVQFRNWATGGVPPYHFSWDLEGDGQLRPVSNPIHVYPDPGRYNATPGVIDSSNPPGAGSGAALPLTVTKPVDPLPAASTAWPLAGNASLAVTFSGMELGGQPPFQYLWDFGNGYSASSANADYLYQAPGRYKAVFVVIDSAGRRGNAPPIEIEVGAGQGELSVVATAAPTSGPAPLDVAFTAIASGGDPTRRFLWEFGDGTNGSMPTVRHLYGTPGIYVARVEVTDGLGATALSRPMTMTVGRAGNFTVQAEAAPRSGAPPLEVSFTGNATGAVEPTWEWAFGDGDMSTDRAPRHTFLLEGNHGVTLTVTDRDGTMGSASLSIEVWRRPILSVAVSPSEWAGRPGDSQVFMARVTSGDAGDVTDKAEYAWEAPAFGEFNASRWSTAKFTASGSGVGVLSVRAFHSGHRASATARLIVTETSDRPEVRILSPENGSTVVGLVPVKGVAESARPVERVEVKVDEGDWALVTSNSTDWSSWETRVDFTGLNGSHVISARATAAGVHSPEVSVTVIIGLRGDENPRPAFPLVGYVIGLMVAGFLTILILLLHRKRRRRRLTAHADSETKKVAPISDNQIEAVRKAAEKATRRKAVIYAATKVRAEGSVLI